MMEVWHRGKVRYFDDEDEADEWTKEIDMAIKEKREPKAKKAAVKPKPKAEAPPAEPPDYKGCDNCGVVVEESNTGGFFVSHPSRGGNLITGSFQPGEDASEWLARVHAEETQ